MQTHPFFLVFAVSAVLGALSGNAFADNKSKFDSGDDSIATKVTSGKALVARVPLNASGGENTAAAEFRTTRVEAGAEGDVVKAWTAGFDLKGYAEVTKSKKSGFDSGDSTCDHRYCTLYYRPTFEYGGRHHEYSVPSYVYTPAVTYYEPYHHHHYDHWTHDYYVGHHESPYYGYHNLYRPVHYVPACATTTYYTTTYYTTYHTTYCPAPAPVVRYVYYYYPACR